MTMSYLVDIPTNIEVFDTDVVMAYILTGIDDDVDIWEPLPQTIFFEDGILLYGFNHTFFDVNFFLDGTEDFASLDPLFTDGVVFRVAIIPAAFAETLDLTNINDVMSAMEIENVERY